MLTVALEHGKRGQRVRWVAIVKTSIGFNHIPMSITNMQYNREQAQEFAQTELAAGRL